MDEPKFSITEFFTLGWEAYKKNFGLLLGVTIFVVVLYIIGDLTSRVLKNNEMLLASILVSIIFYFINLFFRIGTVIINLKIASEAPASFSDITSGGSLVMRVFLFELVLGLLFTIIMIPFALIAFLTVYKSSGYLSGMLLFMILPFIIICYISIRLMFCEYFIIDKYAGIIEAMKKSWELTNNRAFNLLLFIIAAILINIAGLIACLVGALVTYPVTMLAIIYMYKLLSGYGELNKPADELPPEFPPVDSAGTV